MKYKSIKVESPRHLKEVLRQLEEGLEDNGPKTLLGTLPEHLVTMYKNLQRKEMKLNQEMDGRIEELAVKMRNMVHQEFSDRMLETEELHEELWSNIYKYFGADPSNTYTIDRKTNKLYQDGIVVNPNPFKH